jgi:hypothetical protein
MCARATAVKQRRAAPWLGASPGGAQCRARRRRSQRLRGRKGQRDEGRATPHAANPEPRAKGAGRRLLPPLRQHIAKHTSHLIAQNHDGPIANSGQPSRSTPHLNRRSARAAMEVPVLRPTLVSLSGTADRMLAPGANTSTQAPLQVSRRDGRLARGCDGALTTTGAKSTNQAGCSSQGLRYVSTAGVDHHLGSGSDPRAPVLASEADTCSPAPDCTLRA